MTPIDLTGIVADHITAVNANDLDAIMATFAKDAFVNDARNEFVGVQAVRRWVADQMVGDHITIDVREVLDHHGLTIMRGVYDGTFDRANLPDEVILTNYFSVRDNKIVSLVVSRAHRGHIGLRTFRKRREQARRQFAGQAISQRHAAGDRGYHDTSQKNFIVDLGGERYRTRRRRARSRGRAAR
jgi:hypothetical protein